MPSLRVPRLSPIAAVVVGLLAVVFAWYARQPLHHTDLWGHLAYGRLIARTHAIPACEPFMPLARDTPLVDTAWLSQAALYAIDAQTGLAGLQAWHGLSVVLACGLLLWPLMGGWKFERPLAHPSGKRRGSAPPSTPPPKSGTLPAAVSILVGLSVFLSLEWFQLAIIRPQTGGLVCFIALVDLTTTRYGLRRAAWFVPALFVVWANLHGSFIVGVSWLAMTALGRALDVARRTGHLAAPMADRHTRRLLQLTSLAAFAACLNPYGWRLWKEALWFSANPNLRDLLEWQRLDWRTRQAHIFFASVLLLLVACLTARRKLAWRTMLSLALFGAGALWSARLIVWWAPLAARFAALQFARLTLPAPYAGITTPSARTPQAVRPQVALSSHRAEEEPAMAKGRQQSFRFWTAHFSTAVAAILWAAAIINSPIGRQTLLRRQIDPTSQLSARTPLGAARFLRGDPPAGLVFNRYEWGDYLLWAGPPGVQVFVTSQAHLVPPAVWRDYAEISAGAADSLARFDRYRVRAVVLDPKSQPELEQLLAANDTWACVHADALSVVFARNTPLKTETGSRTTENSPRN